MLSTKPHILLLFLLMVLGCEQPLSFDSTGVAHGTGERVYKYESGSSKLREDYLDGQLVRSRWYKPDGGLVAETNWKDGTGEGIYLREDGTIRSRVQYVNGLANGNAVDYDEAGKIIKTQLYRDGKPIHSDESTTRPGA